MSEVEEPDDERQSGAAAGWWSLWFELGSLIEMGPQALGVMAMMPRLMDAARELSDELSRVERDVEADKAARFESMVDTLLFRLDALMESFWAHEDSLWTMSERLGRVAARASANPHLAASLAKLGEAALDGVDRGIEALVEASLKPERSHPADRALLAAELIAQRLIARLVERAFPDRQGATSGGSGFS